MGRFMDSYGASLASLDRFDQAEPALLEGIEILEKAVGTDHRFVRTASHNIASMYERWGKAAEAEFWRRRANTAAATRPTAP